MGGGLQTPATPLEYLRKEMSTAVEPRRIAPAGPAGGQYSDGNKNVVTLRSASVIIHRQLSP
jgi:hypothetical protein